MVTTTDNDSNTAHSSTGIIRRWLIPGAIGLFVTAFLLAFLFVPSPHPQTLINQEFPLSESPELRIWESSFQLETPAPRLRISIEAEEQPVSLLLDLTGPPRVYLLVDFPIDKANYQFWCGRDLPAGDYSLRIREQKNTGRYQIKIARPPRISFHLRSMIMLGLFAILSAVLWLRAVKSRKSTAHKPSTIGWVFAFGGSGICALLIYLIFHEGGHALVALFLGTLDIGQSDPFGFTGRPHISYRGGEALTDWQILVRAAAGPILPTLIGFFSFSLWRSKWGCTLRSANRSGDIFWTLITFGLLAGQIGMLLPVLSLAHDGDYDTMTRHDAIPVWAIDVLLSILAVAALIMIFYIVKDLVKLVRSALSQQQS